MNKFCWKIGGEAGFGIMTTGLALGKIAIRSGYNAYDYTEYPSLIRGGHNTYEVVISEDKVTAPQWQVDMLVCLNKDTYVFHKNRLTSTSIVVYDPKDFQIEDNVVKVEVPFNQLKRDLKIMQVMVNTIALGASLALLQGDEELFYAIIEDEFRRKGQEVIDFNKKLANSGFEHIKNNYAHAIKNILGKRESKTQGLLNANDTFSLASITADCRFYCAYPMTPSSAVLANLAGWSEKTGMVVRHAEDEISVIITALGSSFAGVRSAVGTSGGGFALMVEALSFAGIAEIPIVVYLGQRPGPATGMPTWTEQGDLLFACHAGHGEFPKIVIAPGDAEEMLEATIEAYNLADIYQTPVIVMSDKLICESHQSFDMAEITSILSNSSVQRGKLTSQWTEGTYLRYKLSEDGISERLIPGVKGQFYQANSYEHLQDSHTTEESQPRIEQVNKRNQKLATFIQNHFKAPKIYGNIDESEAVFVSWGGNKGAIREAQRTLDSMGRHFAYIHFTYVHPLDREKVRNIFKLEKRYILIENNSHAQFGKLLRMETGIELNETLLKYDGRPILPEEIVDYILGNYSAKKYETKYSHG